MTVRERLATLETRELGHGREHGYLERAWTSQLEAINTRLGRIEAALNGWRAGANGASGPRRFASRDLGVAGGAMAFATAIWWLVDLLRAAGGGG